MSKFRTLIRITEVTEDVVIAVVPGWNSNATIRLDRASVPLELELGTYIRRVHAQADLNAETVDQLDLSDWETE